MASRGEVWLIDLSPTRGHEPRGRRPALVISTDVYNHGPANLLVIAPLTSTDRRIPLHIGIDPPEGGVRERSFIMCDAVRSVWTERLVQRWGTVGPRTLARVGDGLKILLDL